MRGRPVVRKLAGTGAALSVNVGFRPKLVILINETQASVSFHADGMGDGDATTIDDSGAGATDVEVKTSGAVTLSSFGFEIGTDADLNTADDVIYAIAF